MMCVTFRKTAHASHDIPSPPDKTCAGRAFIRAFIVTANRPFPQAVRTVS